MDPIDDDDIQEMDMVFAVEHTPPTPESENLEIFFEEQLGRRDDVSEVEEHMLNLVISSSSLSDDDDEN